MFGAKSIAAVALIAILLSCAPSDPRALISEGHTALGSGNPKSAESKFTEALKSLEPGDDLYVEAKLGVVEALISSDPKKATEEFLALAAAFPNRVGGKEFDFICGCMVSAHEYKDAIELVKARKQSAAGDSTEMLAQIARIKKEAASDRAVIAALAGIGY